MAEPLTLLVSVLCVRCGIGSRAMIWSVVVPCLHHYIDVHVYPNIRGHNGPTCSHKRYSFLRHETPGGCSSDPPENPMCDVRQRHRVAFGVCRSARTVILQTSLRIRGASAARAPSNCQ